MRKPAIVSDFVSIYSPKVKPSERVKVQSVEEVVEIFRSKYNGDLQTKEKVYAMYFTSSMQVIAVELLNIGTAKTCVFDIQAIIRGCLMNNAQRLIVCHNHPSGNTNPSISDKKMHRQLKSACRLMNIELCDNIIITEESFGQIE